MVEQSRREILEKLKALENRMSLTPDDIFHHPEFGMSVFDATSDGIIIADTNLRMVLVNHAVADLLGTRIEDLIGEDVQMIIPPEHREQHLAKAKAYIKDPHPRTFRDLEALKSDGSRVPVSINIGPLMSHDGFLIMAVIRERD